MQRYQCSEQSTDDEVEAIFLSAIDRQKTFEQEDAYTCAARSVVLLDEAGLPKEKEMPLKVRRKMETKSHFNAKPTFRCCTIT